MKTKPDRRRIGTKLTFQRYDLRKMEKQKTKFIISAPFIFGSILFYYHSLLLLTSVIIDY